MGLALAAVAGFATLVWAPTGISIAALLIYGRGMWPGVFLGAALVNAITGAPLLVAAGIGLGNTLEAVTAVYLLRQLSGFRCSLDRIRDAIALILAAALGSLISASIGVASLEAGSIITGPSVRDAFGAWWLGDLIGALIVTPLILIWSTRPMLPKGASTIEALALAVAVIGIAAIIFTAPPAKGATAFAQVYMIFPFLIWAALRFGPRAVVTSVFVVAVFAIWGTTAAHGPFVYDELYESLFSLQTFMAVVASTFLLLGASIAERRDSAREVHLARVAADEANRAKSDFIAVMSHELRTPLNAIAGYVELLLMGVDGQQVTEKQRESLVRIQRNEQHLLSLINDVLDFARVEAGQQILSIGKVSVAEALHSLEPLVEPDVLRKDISLVFTPTDSGLAARGDGDKVRRILLNFASNAVKFTPQGGEISLGAAQQDGQIRIWVRDNGIGIPAEHLERVFDPFVQMDVGKTRKYSGVGLGLTISRDLARAMNGEAQLERNENGGCTAVLTLPAA